MIALLMGFMSRSHERSRVMGNAATVVAVIAIVAATATLVWF